MDQPLWNNNLEFAEVPSTGVAVIWLLLLCNLQAQKYDFMENSALETDTGHRQKPRRSLAHSPAAGSDAGMGQAWRQPHCQSTQGKRASCWLPSHSLPSALWLAEGRFHHPPAPWLLSARSPASSVYTDHFIHRTRILWLLVWYFA